MRRKMLLKIYFENEQDIMPITYGLKILMRRAIEATLDYEQFCNGCEVSLTFTDNMGIRELNNKFRHIDRETDVLSFPLFDFEGETEEPPIDEIIHNLGDIVISLEKAKEQEVDLYAVETFEHNLTAFCQNHLLHHFFKHPYIFFEFFQDFITVLNRKTDRLVADKVTFKFDHTALPSFGAMPIIGAAFRKENEVLAVR